MKDACWQTEIEGPTESPVEEQERSAVPPIARIRVAHKQVVTARCVTDVGCVPDWVELEHKIRLMFHVYSQFELPETLGITIAYANAKICPKNSFRV